jgi:hypothetical protein
VSVIINDAENLATEIKIISAAGDYCFFLAGLFPMESSTTVGRCRDQGLAMPFYKVPLSDIYPSALSSSISTSPSEQIIKRMRAASSILSLKSDRIWISNLVQDGFEGWLNDVNLHTINDMPSKKYAYKKACRDRWVATYFDDDGQKFDPWVRTDGDEKRVFTCLRDTTQEENFQSLDR